MEIAPLLLAGLLAIYILASRVAMRFLGGQWREAVMLLFNLAAVYYLLLYHPGGKSLSKLRVYVAIVVFQYLMLRFFCGARGRLFWLAFFSPIAALIAIRYGLGEFFVVLGHVFARKWAPPPGSLAQSFVGISYLAFRCSRLALEVRNGDVKKPGFLEYLNFAFFLPTMPVGPINTYANFRRGFEAMPWEVPVGHALLRIAVGLIKYRFLGGIFVRSTYDDFLRNGHPHNWIDLPIAMVFYFLFLYCNFSGFCDMAIGAAALIGIPVLENFNNPFAARNMKDFWNRWHITLSQWMRDIVFAPLSKFLVRVMGPTRVNHAIALAIFVVFLLIGIWHGVGWNYAIFGLFQALGVVANHYYTIGLKKWLGRDGFKAYIENRWIHAAAVSVTFAYYAASLMFFANTIPEIKEICRNLR
jgi:D-alanyl-lipoteichoic acid acyltransferase DltB (MBOAT superfamily)